LARTSGVLVQGVVVNLSDGAVLVHQVLVSLLSTETSDGSESSATNGNSDRSTRTDQESLLPSAVQDGAKNATLSSRRSKVATLALHASPTDSGIVGDASRSEATNILVGARTGDVDASSKSVARGRVAIVVGDVGGAVLGCELASEVLVASGVNAANVGGSADHVWVVASQGIGGGGGVAEVLGAIVLVIARERGEGTVLAGGGAHPGVDGTRVAVIACEERGGDALAGCAAALRWVAKIYGAFHRGVVARGNSTLDGAQVLSAQISVGAVLGLQDTHSSAALVWVAQIARVADNRGVHTISSGGAAGVHGARVVVVTRLVDVRATGSCS